MIDKNKVPISFLIVDPTDGKKININWFVNTFYKKQNKIYSCYIPRFDLRFTTTSLKAIKLESINLIQTFISDCLSKNSFRKFIYKLYALGFCALTDIPTIKQLINKRNIALKFLSIDYKVPKGFSEMVTHKSAIGIAV